MGATLKGLWEMVESMNHSLQDDNLNYRLEDYRLVRKLSDKAAIEDGPAGKRGAPNKLS